MELKLKLCSTCYLRKCLIVVYEFSLSREVSETSTQIEFGRVRASGNRKLKTQQSQLAASQQLKTALCHQAFHQSRAYEVHFETLGQLGNGEGVVALANGYYTISSYLLEFLSLILKLQHIQLQSQSILDQRARLHPSGSNIVIVKNLYIES